jgi:leucyl/phenylalanyl-tRNA--protein transferase
VAIKPVEPAKPTKPAKPIEPPPSPWQFPDPRSADGDVVGVGADLEPGTLLAAYRAGIFPMPTDDQLVWWSPESRGVLPWDGLRVSRSLRRSAGRFTVTVDRAFTDVVAACADPGRPHGWISAEIAAAYGRLHELGWAHSVEVWSRATGGLAGGLYGVAVGGLFAGESMFHRETDASKVALVELVELLRSDNGGAGDEPGGHGGAGGEGGGAGDEPGGRSSTGAGGEEEGGARGGAAGGGGRLLDVQWLTPHLASLGAVEVPRAVYLERLAAALALPLPAVWRT